MFFAAVIAAAFVEDDPEKLLQIGLSQIPEKSRLAEAIKDIIQMSKEYDDWTECADAMMEKYGHYSAVHTINNALIVAIGMLYGGDDFEKNITIAVMCGLDTDCTGATIGSIAGIIRGFHQIPRKWAAPLNDTIDSQVIGFGKIRISDLAQRTLELYNDFN
jgi:ADP-ribosylglycohydrolase